MALDRVLRRATFVALLVAPSMSVAQQPGFVLDVALVPAALAPAPVSSPLVLALPHPIGAAAFAVATTHAGVSGNVTVTVDTGRVPLPVTARICQTDAGTSDCLAPPATSLSVALAAGQALTFAVSVEVLSPLPLDRDFHRVHVRFTDASGASVGGASVAVHNTNYVRQIPISKGGTYSGSWSNDHFETGAPGGGGNAVFIDTTEPVTLENCFLRSTKGHIRTMQGARLTIRNCNAYGLPPDDAGTARGFFLFGPAIGSLTMEHNYLEGMAWGVALWSEGNQGRWTPSGPIVIRYNQVRNLDGLNGDGHGGRITAVNPNSFSSGFVSISQLNLVHGAEVAWNEIVNEPFVSAVADLINFWASPGTAASPVLIHDNFIHGQYAPVPQAGNGINPQTCTPGQPRCYGSYVAQVIVLDGHEYGETPQTATSFMRIYNNQLVNTWGGITLTGGHDNEAWGNRVVSTGRLRNGSWMAPAYSAGITVSDNYQMGPAVFYNNSAHDNVVGFVLERVSPADPLVYLSPPIRSDYSFVHSGCAGRDAALCFNNQSLPDPITFETEDNETVLWQHKRADDHVKVGPVLPADCLFDWAESRYAELLRPAGAATRAWPPYVFRHYPDSQTYIGLAVTDNHLYYLGPLSDQRLLDLGAASDWYATANCRY